MSHARVITNIDRMSHTGKEGTRSGSRMEHNKGYIRRRFWRVVVVSFFPLYITSSVIIHTIAFAFRTSLLCYFVATQPHSHPQVALQCCFLACLSYYVALLISSDRRERTCWSCGIHHGRSSLRITLFELQHLQMVFIIPLGHPQSRFPQVLMHGTPDGLPLRDSNAAHGVISFRRRLGIRPVWPGLKTIVCTEW
jgi:hypothetical protein